MQSNKMKEITITNYDVAEWVYSFFRLCGKFIIVCIVSAAHVIPIHTFTHHEFTDEYSYCKLCTAGLLLFIFILIGWVAQICVIINKLRDGDISFTWELTIPDFLLLFKDKYELTEEEKILFEEFLEERKLKNE